MSVYAPLLGSIWRLLVAYGVDPASVISEKHFRPGQERTHPLRISFDDFDATLARAATHVQDPAVGIRAAEHLHPSHFGALGHAFLASASLRNALRRYRHYSRFFNEDTDVELEAEARGLRVLYRTLRPTTRPNLLADAQLGILLRLCRMIYDEDLVPLEVTFRRPQPPDADAWFRYFGPNLVFGQHDNSLLFDTAAVDRPLTGGDSRLVEIHEQLIEQSLRFLDGESILHRTRVAVMRHLPTGSATEEAIADEFGISKRTLHRRLREHDESFRSVLAQVRRDLAERYVRSLDYSVTDMTFLLGYTNTSAFARAFRQWFGCSPSDMRENARAH